MSSSVRPCTLPEAHADSYTSIHLSVLVSRVRRALRRRFPTVCAETIADATSAAVESILQNSSRFSTSESDDAYTRMWTAGCNVLRRELRYSRRHVALDSLEEESEWNVAGEDHMGAEMILSTRLLRELLILTLGVTLAETAWLHEIEGCPPREIAQMQGVAIGAVKARITRSRQLLRNRLQPNSGQERDSGH